MSPIDRRRPPVLLRTPRDVGAVVRQRRRDLHLDQRTLAERVSVSRQWIIDCEKGKPRAELGLVLRTLAVLGLRLSAGVEPASKAKSALEAPDIDAIVNAARKSRR
jgi:HTH-type transcriptional regulator/antitoxin HipB